MNIFKIILGILIGLVLLPFVLVGGLLIAETPLSIPVLVLLCIIVSVIIEKRKDNETKRQSTSTSDQSKTV